MCLPLWNMHVCKPLNVHLFTSYIYLSPRPPDHNSALQIWNVFPRGSWQVCYPSPSGWKPSTWCPDRSLANPHSNDCFSGTLWGSMLHVSNTLSRGQSCSLSQQSFGSQGSANKYLSLSRRSLLRAEACPEAPHWMVSEAGEGNATLAVCL